MRLEGKFHIVLIISVFHWCVDIMDFYKTENRGAVVFGFVLCKMLQKFGQLQYLPHFCIRNEVDEKHQYGEHSFHKAIDVKNTKKVRPMILEEKFRTDINKFRPKMNGILECCSL